MKAPRHVARLQLPFLTALAPCGAPQPHDHSHPTPAPPPPQGKVDPARRNYRTIFAEMLAHREELLARNLSVAILGKGGGRRDASVVQIPEELLQAGLVVQHASLPFQVGRGGGTGAGMQGRRRAARCAHIGALQPACLRRGRLGMKGGEQARQEAGGGLGTVPARLHAVGTGRDRRRACPASRRSTTRCCTRAWRWPLPLPTTPTTSTRGPPPLGLASFPAPPSSRTVTCSSRTSEGAAPGAGSARAARASGEQASGRV